MRWQSKVLILAALAVIGLNLALAQAQFQFGAGFGGGLAGLLGKDSRPDPIALLRNPEVKKELKITDKDSDKVDTAIWKALKEALDEDQYRRLKQIDLQQRDYQAFGDQWVQEELKLDKEQASNIKMILADSEKNFNDLIKTAQEGIAGGNFGGIQSSFERLGALKKEAKDRCTEVLTAEQRRYWQEMVGEEFKMAQPNFAIPDFKNFNKDQKGQKGKKKG